MKLFRNDILENLWLALATLRDNKLRSFLTVIGVIIGVVTVMLIASIISGIDTAFTKEVEAYGTRSMYISKNNPGIHVGRLSREERMRKPLTYDDALALSKLPAVDVAVPFLEITNNFFGQKILVSGGGKTSASVALQGTLPDFEKAGTQNVTEGRFFDRSENDAAAPVCVLGAAAKESLFGAAPAIGEYIKLNEQWCHVIGIVAPQLAPQTEVSGVRTEDMNNLIYAPLNAVRYRLEDSQSFLKDEIDGLYLHLASPETSTTDAEVVRGILNSSHHGAGDFNVIVPAELLAQQKRTEQLFNTVMVAIASISLLVGGIGIMNIMLAAILERTREIGVRRAVGARRWDIIRQFVIEAVLISFAGGLLGVLLGFTMSQLIAWLAGWSTIVTISSILLAFVVSISVGLIFGIYPAVKAARLDPVEAIRYE